MGEIDAKIQMRVSQEESVGVSLSSVLNRTNNITKDEDPGSSSICKHSFSLIN